MKPGIVRVSSSERSVNAFFTPQTLFRFAIHSLICIIAFILGFCISREALLVVLSLKHPPFLAKTASSFNGRWAELPAFHPYASVPGKKISLSLPHLSEQHAKNSTVHVGRHQILVRPWPHPLPTYIRMAYRLMEVVQETQRRLYGTEKKHQLIVITPTHVRTFQALYMSTLMHTLRLVPGPLTWIVIEAGGASEETATLLAKSGLSVVHLHAEEAMPSTWQAQQHMKIYLRVEGLRYVRDQHLDGIIVFADDSNIYSLEFFDEVQQVKWIGAVSMGLLYTSDLTDVSEEEFKVQQNHQVITSSDEAKQWFPIHGPACNRTGQLIGWYAPNATLQVAPGGFKQEADLLPLAGIPEWANFVLNARLLWETENPRWIQDWEHLDLENLTYFSPLDIVKDVRLVEPLASCGQYIWLWSVQDEAYPNCRFPSRWIIDPPLEVIVPSKHTPWTGHAVSLSTPTAFHDVGEHNEIGKRKGKHSPRGTRGKKGLRHSEKKRRRNNDLAAVSSDRTKR